MKIVVDLTRCQSYGQCVFAAPTVFRFHGAEALEYDYEPDETLHTQVQWAAAACPVHAISLDCMDDRISSMGHPGTDTAETEPARAEMSGGSA